MKNLKKLGCGGNPREHTAWVHWLSHKETPSSKKIFNTNFIQRKCEKILPYAKSNYASQIRPARLVFFVFLTTAIDKCTFLFSSRTLSFISFLIWVTSWKLYSSHPLINNGEKGNKTKMYNRMYWNDIIQLIFLIYIHHLFALFNASCFTQHTKWYYSIRSVTDSTAVSCFPSNCLCFMLT